MAPSYRLGKGSIVRRIERHLEDPDNLQKLLDDLIVAIGEQNDGGLTTIPTFEQAFEGNDRTHLNDDVWDPQTGGNERRRVYYEGFRQALQLAKDLGDEGRPAKIQIFWSCGGRVNQCWVSWAGPKGRAVVTMILLSDVSATGVSDDDAMEPVPVEEPDTAAADDSGSGGVYIVRLDDDGKAKMFKTTSVVGV